MVKTDTKGSSFRNVLRIIFSRKKIILFPLLGIMGLVLAVGLIAPPKYETVAKIMAEERKGENPFQAQFYYDHRTERVAFLQSQLEIILSDEVARRVMTKLFPAKKDIVSGQVKSFQEDIKVSSPEGYDFTSSDILLIQVVDSNPVRAAEKANLLTNEYIKYAYELKGKAAKQTLEFLEKQAQIQLDKIGRAEELVKNFERKSSPELAFFIATVKTKGANAELITLNNNYLAAKVALKETESYLNQLRHLVPKGAISQKLVRENPVLTAIKDNIVKLETQLATLNLPPEIYPKNIRIMKEVERSKQIFDQELKADIEGRFVDAMALEAQVKTLKKMVDQYTAMAQQQLNYLKLYRDYELLEEGYQDLLRNIQKARIAEIYKLTNIEIIDEAKIPKSPISSNVIRNTLTGGMIGLLLGLGLAFVLDFFDHTLKSIEDIERYLDMQVLGSIPRQ